MNECTSGEAKKSETSCNLRHGGGKSIAAYWRGYLSVKT
jgi:hypothetical protein